MNSNMSASSPLKVWRSCLNCETCSLRFFIKDFTLKGSRCPLLLPCGHSVCESCISQNLKVTKDITCQVCSCKTTPQTTEQNQQCFPISMYLVGNLVLQNSRNEKERKSKAFFMERCGNFNYAVKQQAKLNSKQDLSNSACEECSVTALWYCENCKSNFCEVCWCRVHGLAKSLMKHCKTAISNVETSRIVWRKCPEHDTQDLEFYCKGCSTTVCSHCIILQHQGEGHCPIALKEKNIEILNHIKAAAEEAEKISKRMKHTLEKIRLTESSYEAPDTPFSDAERQITRNFSRMHGVLQLEQERLLGELHAKSNERENCIRSLRLKLEKQIENVEDLLRDYERAVQKPQEGDLTALHVRLKEVQDLPCYLISPNSGDEEAKVAFDERLVESLKTYCTMDLPRSQVFELRSGSNLPEGYAVEPLDVSDSERKAKPEGESGASDADAFGDPSSRDSAKAEDGSSSARASKDPVAFQEGKNYSVCVTYIRNPGEFYVTLNSQRSKQQAIDRRASHVAASSLEIPHKVKKDEIYLVKYKVDKKWYRARVVEVFLPRRTGDEECVLVYYLDYGNSETVAVSRLRPLPADMLEPPLAVRCKLFDCVPKKGQWCVESAKTMEKILNKCTATMFVMKVHPHCLEVDLSVIYPDGQIGRDIVSVRDALLFLEFSSFVHGSTIPRNPTALKYLQECLPSAGETLEVVVTHVNSPSDFYVQKEDASYLYKLTMDLQKYYSENLQKGYVYNPAVGMPCAALFRTDQRWYRAKIVDVPGKKMVTVFYVDYGNKETIPWTEIRKLTESFVKWPPLALNCTLAGTDPAGEFWSEQALSQMKECLMTRGFLIRVHGKPKPKQKLKVFLYKEENGTEVCVNGLLVDTGCAVSTGANRLWNVIDPEEKAPIRENFIPKIRTQYRKTANNEEDEDQTGSDGERNARRRNRTFTGRNRCKLSAKQLRELHESEKRNSRETSSAVDPGNDVVDYDNIFKVKVEILSAESPSSIYVTFPALMEEFEDLQAKLNEFYQNSSPTAVEWAAGRACAVFDSSKNSWYRASVLCTLPNGQVKVFLKDVARVSSEPASALRELDPSFTKYASAAVKCHLADVGPPGQQWPSISSEFLASELELFKEVYMTKRGQIDNKSLPVELWVQKVEPRGALEPSVKEWITLNRLLVNQGLAVPLKEKDWSLGAPSADGGECGAEANEGETPRTAGGEEEEPESGDASDVFVPSLSTRWRSPEPLGRTRFVGVPTYVDLNAHVHLYDAEQDQNRLKTIRDALHKEYHNSKPSSEDHFWSPGQLCIVRYHADNSWYRGAVMQVNEDLTYDVLFVDYGNVETCQVADLRKGIKMHEIPILSRKFQLCGIGPTSEDGEWPVAIIDHLHSLVVDKECEVTVLKPSLNPGGPHIVSLKVIECDVDVGAFLVGRDLAAFTCSLSEGSATSDSDALVPSPNEDRPVIFPEAGMDSGIPRCYISLDVPDDGGGFFIEITTLESEREFFANVADHESTSSVLKTILNEFENLQKRLTDECHLQPVLEKLTEGQPCCCVNARTDRWCRGEVQSSIKTDDSVSVFYVDHGEKEFLNKDLLRACKSEWLNLPKMAVKFRLGNVEKCPEVSESAYMRALTKCLYRSPLFAEILSKQEDVFEVRLLTKKGGPLAYQEMIDEKLMAVIAQGPIPSLI